MAGRTIIALAPLWLLGFLLHRYRGWLTPKMPAPFVAWVVSALALVVLPFALFHVHWNNFGYFFPWGRGPFNRDLLGDYAVAVAFAVHLVAADRLLGQGHRLLERCAAPVRYLGGLTFPMYAIHYPALCFLAAVTPWRREAPLRILAITVAVALVIVAVTPLCDWLKTIMRRAMGPTTRVADAAA